MAYNEPYIATQQCDNNVDVILVWLIVYGVQRHFKKYFSYIVAVSGCHIRQTMNKHCDKDMDSIEQCDTEENAIDDENGGLRQQFDINTEYTDNG